MPNEGYFCKIPIIKQDTNLISQTVCQTKFLPPPLQLVCPKTYRDEFSSDFEQFFLVKNMVCAFFKEKMWLPNRKCYGEKVNSILTRKKCSKWLDTSCIYIFGCANSVHNDADDVHNSDDYNRVIGISKCEQNFASTQTLPVYPPTYIQMDILTWVIAIRSAPCWA